MSKLVFESHRPERRRRPSVTLTVGGCSSCCCCLHTVGSLVGAIFAPAFAPESPSPFTLPPGATDRVTPPAPETGVRAIESAIQSSLPVPIPLHEDEDRPSVRLAGSGLDAVRLFWSILAGLSIVGMIWMGFMIGADGFGASLFLLALTMPGLQLVSAFLTTIVLLFSRRPDRDYQLGRIGRIALGTALGTVAGVLLMILIGFLLTFAR